MDINELLVVPMLMISVIVGFCYYLSQRDLKNKQREIDNLSSSSDQEQDASGYPEVDRTDVENPRPQPHERGGIDFQYYRNPSPVYNYYYAGRRYPSGTFPYYRPPVRGVRQYRPQYFYPPQPMYYPRYYYTYPPRQFRRPARRALLSSLGSLNYSTSTYPDASSGVPSTLAAAFEETKENHDPRTTPQMQEKPVLKPRKTKEPKQDRHERSNSNKSLPRNLLKMHAVEITYDTPPDFRIIEKPDQPGVLVQSDDHEKRILKIGDIQVNSNTKAREMQRLLEKETLYPLTLKLETISTFEAVFESRPLGLTFSAGSARIINVSKVAAQHGVEKNMVILSVNDRVVPEVVSKQNLESLLGKISFPAHISFGYILSENEVRL